MDYWDVHGIFFLIFLAFFPRLTMFLTGVCFMDFVHPILFWVGWFLAPRLTIAILATTFYWNTNPVLCVLAWMIAFGGESAEKGAIASRRE